MVRKTLQLHEDQGMRRVKAVMGSEVVAREVAPFADILARANPSFAARSRAVRPLMKGGYKAALNTLIFRRILEERKIAIDRGFINVLSEKDVQHLKMHINQTRNRIMRTLYNSPVTSFRDLDAIVRAEASVPIPPPAWIKAALGYKKPEAPMPKARPPGKWTAIPYVKAELIDEHEWLKDLARKMAPKEPHGYKERDKTWDYFVKR